MIKTSDLPVVVLPGTDALSMRWGRLIDDLKEIAERFPSAVLASSLAAEDMVLTHAIYTHGIALSVFSLDTGRLPGETLALIERVGRRYGREMEIWRPEAARVQAHVQEHGAFAFYESIALRKACCHIRKVEPLTRALKGRGAWITGQRREQSATRTDIAQQEYDSVFGLWKFNPLAQWTHEDVWQAIREFDIPYNALHDQGYPSIGCEPCTRAVKPGEDLRAGRWWWESADSKECGLHAANLAQPGSYRNKA